MNKNKGKYRMTKKGIYIFAAVILVTIATFYQLRKNGNTMHIGWSAIGKLVLGNSSINQSQQLETINNSIQSDNYVNNDTENTIDAEVNQDQSTNPLDQYNSKEFSVKLKHHTKKQETIDSILNAINSIKQEITTMNKTSNTMRQCVAGFALTNRIKRKIADGANFKSELIKLHSLLEELSGDKPNQGQNIIMADIVSRTNILERLEYACNGKIEENSRYAINCPEKSIKCMLIHWKDYFGMRPVVSEQKRNAIKIAISSSIDYTDMLRQIYLSCQDSITAELGDDLQKVLVFLIHIEQMEEFLLNECI